MGPLRTPSEIRALWVNLTEEEKEFFEKNVVGLEPKVVEHSAPVKVKGTKRKKKLGGKLRAPSTRLAQAHLNVPMTIISEEVIDE